jgi:hypothetical protein
MKFFSAGWQASNAQSATEPEVPFCNTRIGNKNSVGMFRMKPWLTTLLLLASLAVNLVQFQWLTVSKFTSSDATGCVPRFAVIMDAGSTGSRIHVYEFIMTGVGHILLRDELFEQLKPGLSAYATNPKIGALSLAPLLKSATLRVPKKLQPGTIVALG